MGNFTFFSLENKFFDFSYEIFLNSNEGLNVVINELNADVNLLSSADENFILK